MEHPYADTLSAIEKKPSFSPQSSEVDKNCPGMAWAPKTCYKLQRPAVPRRLPDHHYHPPRLRCAPPIPVTKADVGR